MFENIVSYFLWLAISVIAWAILLLPLAYAVDPVSGIRAVVISAMIIAIMPLLLIRTRLNLKQKMAVGFIVALCAGAATITNTWILAGHVALANEIAVVVFAALAFFIAMILANFVMTLVNVDTAKDGVTTAPTWSVGLCFLFALAVNLKLPAHVNIPRPETYVLPSIIVFIMLSFAAQTVGVRIGRTTRVWLGGGLWIWQTMRRLGPPLGFAASGYVFIGVLFGTFHAAIWQQNHAAYKPDKMQGGIGEFIYYSFVTLTTLGYGDIYPQSGAARLCSTFETLAGVIWTILIFGIILSRLSSDDQRTN